jgi:hypothetical protein
MAENGERNERRKEQMRLAQARRLYGLTPEEARALYDLDACEICGGDNGSKRLNIDHCHSGGTVRGVLCNRCNRGLGCFLHDVELLMSAAEYLEKSRSRTLAELISEISARGTKAALPD